MSSRSTNYHAHALTRGLELLRVMSRATSGMVNLTDLHNMTEFPKSTIVRLLAVLENEGFVHRVDETPTYQLGHSVLELAEGYLRSSDVADLARPYLRKLADVTGQTANLGLLDGGEVLHVCVQEPDRPLRFRSVTGSKDAVHCTGLGKMLLAGLDDERVLSVLPREPFDRRTDRTLTRTEELLEDVRASRQRRHALDDEEGSEGVRCLSVPLITQPGQDRWDAAISIAGPAGEVPTEANGKMLASLNEVAELMASDRELMAALSVLGRRPAGM